MRAGRLFLERLAETTSGGALPQLLSLRFLWQNEPSRVADVTSDCNINIIFSSTAAPLEYLIKLGEAAADDDATLRLANRQPNGYVGEKSSRSLT